MGLPGGMVSFSGREGLGCEQELFPGSALQNSVIAAASAPRLGAGSGIPLALLSFHIWRPQR